ncbi:MAG: SMC-Scp complex subunit ScpB [Planctomycetota bacterium]|jgi:segregation and condensation protein B
MTEHEASAVAEQAPTQSGTEAELIGSPDLILDVAVVVAMDAAPKRRSKKSSNSESPEGDHPSLFAINLDDPELPSATMPFTLRVEAAILLADRPISDARIAEVLGLVPPSVRTGKADGAKTEAKTEARTDQGSDESSDNDPSGRDSAAIAGRRREAARVVREAVDALNQQYAATNRAFRVESVAGGRQMLTIAAFGPVLARIKGQRAQTRLSQAALETLAIIAYRQPMLRAQLEAIRGVACGEVLRSLMERRLVKIVGRAEEVGRPMLYGTTPEFLRVFGIATLSDLPQAKDLR